MLEPQIRHPPEPLELKLQQLPRVQIRTPDFKISGEISSTKLQQLLDHDLLSKRLFLDHQRRLDRESNLQVVIIGFIFAIIAGLGVTVILHSVTSQQEHSELIQGNHHA